MANVSIHNVTRLTASTTGTAGFPVCIDARDSNGARNEIVLYVEDRRLAERLAAAINDTMREHAEEVAARAA